MLRIRSNLGHKAPKPEKKKFARLIVDKIRNRDPPGRFLKFDETTKMWYDIGDKKALSKARQALRERAYKFEKMKGKETQLKENASDSSLEEQLNFITPVSRKLQTVSIDALKNEISVLFHSKYCPYKLYIHLNKQEKSQCLSKSGFKQVQDSTLSQTHGSDQHYDIEPIPCTPNDFSFETDNLDIEPIPYTPYDFSFETDNLDTGWINDMLKNELPKDLSLPSTSSCDLSEQISDHECSFVPLSTQYWYGE